MTTTTEKIPAYALNALVNGDQTGMSQQDIDQISQWLSDSEIKEVVCPVDDNAEPYFSFYPAFGKATDVVDCICILEY